MAIGLGQRFQVNTDVLSSSLHFCRVEVDLGGEAAEKTGQTTVGDANQGLKNHVAAGGLKKDAPTSF